MCGGLLLVHSIGLRLFLGLLFPEQVGIDGEHEGVKEIGKLADMRLSSEYSGPMIRLFDVFHDLDCGGDPG